MTDKIDQLNVSAPFAKVSDGTRFDLGVSVVRSGQESVHRPDRGLLHARRSEDRAEPGRLRRRARRSARRDTSRPTVSSESSRGMEGEVEIGVTVRRHNKDDTSENRRRAGRGLRTSSILVQLGGFSVSTGGSVSDVTYGYAQGGYKSDGALSVELYADDA